MSNQFEWAKEVVKQWESFHGTSGAITVETWKLQIYKLAKAILADQDNGSKHTPTRSKRER